MLLLAIATVASAPVGAALGFWTGGPGEPLRGTGAGAAASVSQGSTPTVSVQGPSNVVLVSWSASTMSNGGPVGGYLVKRYDAGTNVSQTVLSSCAGTITATSCTETGVPAGDWKYAVTPTVGSNWTGAESAKSATVTTTVPDTQAPTQAFALNSAVGAFLNGATLYYKGDASGSFKLIDTVTDAGSGPASATFPAIATTGWTHGAETVTTPAGGPYTSATFSWTSSPANPAGYAVSAKDVANNTGSAPLTFVSDTTPPAGGGISYTDGVVNALSVPITITPSSDGQSGVNPGSAIVRRAQAPLNTTTETCGAFGGFTTTVTLVGGADTSVASGSCYMYQSLISDNVGNQATYTSASVAKVDTNGPRVTAIASQQSGGSAGNGQLQNGDRLILTFNQSLAPGSVPATFTGATEFRPALGNVTLTIPGITNGARDTGSAGYIFLVLTTATFNGSTVLVNNGTATTLTITVSGVGGLGAPTASQGTLAFAPAATITDGGGNPAAGSFSTASTFKLF